MKRVMVAIGVLAVVSSVPAQAFGQGKEYINAEYWTCPAENMEALAQASDTIWGPFFDELVAEGRITSWMSGVPTAALKIEEQDGERAVVQIPAEWDWVASWTAPTEEAFDAAWALFEERLVEKYPADPRPFLFCESLKIVKYEVRLSKK